MIWVIMQHVEGMPSRPLVCCESMERAETYAHAIRAGGVFPTAMLCPDHGDTIEVVAVECTMTLSKKLG